MINLIGIHGLYGVGKDTVAQIIHEVYGYEIKHFAEPVYKSLWNLNPLIELPTGQYRRLQGIVLDHGWDYAKSIPEVRRGLQVTGTENGRDIHGEDCWVDVAEYGFGAANFVSSPNWVYADLRFDNEAGWINGTGGGCIKVVGPQRRSGGDATKKHASEAGLPDSLFRAIIDNNGTLDDLRVKVISAMEHMTLNFCGRETF